MGESSLRCQFVADSVVEGGRATILKMLQRAAADNTWEANGVDAVDDRVVWSEVDDGVRVYYREEKK